jgi:hypothetical protein
MPNPTVSRVLTGVAVSPSTRDTASLCLRAWLIACENGYSGEGPLEARLRHSLVSKGVDVGVGANATNHQ